MLVGPRSFLLLAKSTEPGFAPLRLLDGLLETYAELLERMAAAGVAEV